MSSLATNQASRERRAFREGDIPRKASLFCTRGSGEGMTGVRFPRSNLGFRELGKMRVSSRPMIWAFERNGKASWEGGEKGAGRDRNRGWRWGREDGGFGGYEQETVVGTRPGIGGGDQDGDQDQDPDSGEGI